MRRLDTGFALLAIALVATLGWWWAGRYAAERTTLVERVDAGLKAWRADQLRRAVTDLVSDRKGRTDSLEVATELISISPNVQVDLERDRVIQIDRRARVSVDSARDDAELPDDLTRVLGNGFALEASGEVVERVLDSLATRLGVTLRLHEVGRAGEHAEFRPFTSETSVFSTAPIIIVASGPRALRSGPTSYVAIEAYPGMLLRRIASELVVGTALLLGLCGFYVVMRRDLRRRTRALAEKDRFIANVAHELKTPIAVVGVALEALEDFGADDDPVRRRRYLRMSREELARLELLAERALGTLQLESAGGFVLRCEPVDLADLVRTSWAALALKYDITAGLATFVKTEAAPVVRGDPQLLRHLFDNLLDNAVKHGGAPGTVAVTLENSGNEVRCRITDRGCGIPMADRERVFEKFYRVGSPEEGHLVKGHGLGLSYAREIVRRHGGRILLGAGPGGVGTEVSVQLPRS